MVAFRMIDWIDWLPKDRYRVGDDGSVWSQARGSRWRRFATEREKRWHGPRVLFTYQGKRASFIVATLVLRAFEGPRPIGCQPFHFPDRSLSNNRLSNLRWAPVGSWHAGTTHEPARREAEAAGAQRGRTARWTTQRQLRGTDVPKIFEYRRQGWTYADIADEFEVSDSVIQGVLRGRSYTDIECDRSLPEKWSGVSQKGSRSGMSKLIEPEIPEIRAKFRNGVSRAALANEYGVAYGTIRAVLEGRTWTHVPDHR